jgi:hypothetical protein
MVQSWYKPLIQSMEMQGKYILELERQVAELKKQLEAKAAEKKEQGK